MTKKNDDAERERGLLPFDVIVAAVQGEPEALVKVIRHYEPYMTQQSKRWVVGPNGQSDQMVDQEIYDEVIIKLM